MALIEVQVPDIGDFKDVPIIEVHVQPGQRVAVDDPLITLESDKATTEVPAPRAGTVQELRVKVGDRVSQGAAILADGLAGGSAAEVVQTLGIREATGTVLDHLYVITPEAARQRLGI